MSETGEPNNSATSETISLIGGTESPPAVETPPAEQPPAEQKPVEASAPLTAESIKLPEGFTADEPVMQEFLGVMNNAELSPQDRAQALVDLQAKAVQAISERGNKLWSDMQDKWQEDARTQFGANLEPVLGNISKLLDTYGGTPEQIKELRDVFILTGAGNHPAMVRFLDNLGKPLREGAARGGSPSGQVRSPAEILYPSMPKGEV